MINGNRLGGLIFLVFCVAYGFLTTKIPLLTFQQNAAFTAKTLPQALTVLGILLSLVLIIKPGELEPLDLTGYHWKQGLLICLAMVIYGFVIRSFGFIPSTVIFLMSGFYILGERRWMMMSITAISLVVFFWVLMTQFLSVHIVAWPEFFS
jgi:putative tricarboxylic transport membrane protein